MDKKEIYRAKNEYNLKHFDRIITTYPKGTKDRIKATGKTMNDFVKAAVLKAMEDAEQ